MLDKYFKGEDFPAQNYIVKDGELASQYRWSSSQKGQNKHENYSSPPLFSLANKLCRLCYSLRCLFHCCLDIELHIYVYGVSVSNVFRNQQSALCYPQHLNKQLSLLVVSFLHHLAIHVSFSFLDCYLWLFSRKYIFRAVPEKLDLVWY